MQVRAKSRLELAVVVKTNGIPFWLEGASPILVYSGWIGMFTGGTFFFDPPTDPVAKVTSSWRGKAGEWKVSRPS